MNEQKWYLRTQEETFGPETEAKLVEWAKVGRIQPGQEISEDNVEWLRVEDVPFLDMRFSIDIGDGNPRGPFNRAAAEALLKSGRLPPTASMVETRAPFPEPEEEAGQPVAEKPKEAEPMNEETSARDEKAEEKEAIREVRVEVPVEKIVEKEVIKEVRVEVPVEKIVEKIVVDETRVKELEGLLAEERRHTAELQARMDEMSKSAAEAAKAAREREGETKAALRAATEQVARYEAALKDATDRENKYVEQVQGLEDELRRLPQAASEVADIQAAVYAIMKDESEELGEIIDSEKREFEELKSRHAARESRLLERRRELLRRTGVNIEDMTRRTLFERPEDPRTVQLRKQLEDLQRQHERTELEGAAKVRELSELLRRSQAEGTRQAEQLRDVTQLRQEVQGLREQLQIREKELVAERQRSEEMRQQQATSQRVLMNRLASLESPSIGTSQTMATNQSREARQVKLASWMHLK